MTTGRMVGAITYLTTLLWLFVSPSTFLLHAREKSDVIVFKNGDRLTCEIKSLTRGHLNIKTDYTIGTIAVNWEKIDRIETNENFQVETQDGRRLVGTLQKDTAAPKGQLLVHNEKETIGLEQGEVVVLRPMGRSFLRRLDGSVDYGFTFNRDNNQVNSSLNSTVKYDTTAYSLQILSNSQFSDQTDGTGSNRQNVSAIYRKYLRRNKWYGVGYLDFLKSNQQQLDLRSTVGAGLGRYWIKTNRTILGASVGVVGTNERFASDSESSPPPASNNIEALLALEYSMFRFDSTEFTTTFVMYPSISRAGRIRANLDSTLKLDLIGDLYWNISFYENFDSAPPADTPRNDFGVTTGVGWSF